MRLRKRGVTERPWVFLLPAGAVFAAITLFPIAHVLWLSLERRSLILDIAEFTGLANYVRLGDDPRFWNALSNTIYFAGVSVFFELLLGLGIALLLQSRFRGRALVYALVLIPWAVPTIVSARMWEWVYNPELGILNYLLGVDINWLGSPAWAMHAAILMDVWKSTPFAALLLLAGLQNIPRELYHAAALDGATRWVVFWRITLPLLRPLLIVVLIFRTIDALRVFDAIYVLTGGGPANSTETLSIYAYKVLFQTLEFGYGSALAVTVLLATGLITLLYIRILRGREAT